MELVDGQSVQRGGWPDGSVSGGWRDSDHEHHAGERIGTHAGDWAAAVAGSQETPHHPAIRYGICGTGGDGRAPWNLPRLCGSCRSASGDVDSDAHPLERSHSLAGDVDGSGSVLWDLSGDARGKAGSDRSIAVGRLRAMAQAHGENLKQAMDTLKAHKLRSFLTVFGVVPGVSVIMLVAALIPGFDHQVQESVKQYGADTAFISRFDQGSHGGGRRPKDERERKLLTLEDAEAIKEGSPAVKNVTVFLTWWEQQHSVRTKSGEVTAIDFRGVQANFGQVYANAATLEGRFISEGDDLHREKVVMLGENAAPVLFPGVSPVGKDVMIDGSAFRVIGVVEKPKGMFGNDDEDRRVLIPYNTFRKIYPGAYENSIRLQAYPNMLDQAVDQATEVLRRRRNVPFNGKDSFSIQTSQQIVEQFHSIMGMVALATIVLSGIGLLIGGVGVMNIMLVSVTERTREIGIRKAIGAKSGDITWQFLLEAMTLTGAGGVIALLLVNGLVLLVRLGLKWPGSVPVWAAATGIVVSVCVGLVFGVWPAMKAAKLDPVEALRYE